MARSKLQVLERRDRKYKVEKSCEKYKSYDPNLWSLEFFDPKTGGYVVVNRKRKVNAIKHKNEGTKYGKELAMAKVFACGGHHIEMLEEISRIPSPDVTIDGIPADLKSPMNVNNIVKDARKAIRKQGARIVLFRFEKLTPYITKELKNLSERGIHGMYIVRGETEIREF